MPGLGDQRTAPAQGARISGLPALRSPTAPAPDPQDPAVPSPSAALPRAPQPQTPPLPDPIPLPPRSPPPGSSDPAGPVHALLRVTPAQHNRVRRDRNPPHRPQAPPPRPRPHRHARAGRHVAFTLPAPAHAAVTSLPAGPQLAAAAVAERAR